MGRKHHRERGPRTQLEPNQEVRRALKGNQPPPFGIRRPLTRASREPMLDVTFGLQDADDIPSHVMLRDQPAVTLLSQKIIGMQMRRGIVAGYNLGRTSAKVERSDDCQERNDALLVVRGGVHVYKNRLIYAEIISPDIDREIKGIHTILGEVGIRGVSKLEGLPIPHLTIGETQNRHHLTKTEQIHIKHRLEETLATSLTVAPWDVYPDGVFSSGRH